MTAKLLARARDGDENAFAALAEPLRDELTAHCYRMLGSFHEAEDMVQEAMARAWKSLARLDEPASIRPWMYKIATNRCLTQLGRTARRRELPTDLTPERPSTDVHWLEPYPGHRMRYADELAPESRTVARESMRLAFIVALQHIPPRQRAVLLLREVLGYSAVETADLLGTTVASVNSALQRARTARTELRTVDERSVPASDEICALADRYATAWEASDVEAIVSLLTTDAVYSMPPLPQYFTGRDAIREFLLDGPLPGRWRFVPTRANGAIAFGTYLWDDRASAYLPCGLDVVEVRAGGVAEVVSFLEAHFPTYGLPERLLPRD
ncbi:MAG TPA: sigma-70 family RNA polymerase sigma factor [Nocardioidaceae bacterium]|nr:sigma-70 family RNA polymerase sigma factor [Nocardioidaceae bacterium]